MTKAPAHHHETSTAAPRMETSYVLGYDGFIYAGTDLSSGTTSRHSAAILVSADHQAVTVELEDGRSISGPALLVPPFLPRKLMACGVALLSVNVMPSHRSFHIFSALQHLGLQALRREPYSPMDAAMLRLLEGELTLEETAVVFEQLIDSTCAQLPETPPLDPTARKIVDMLDDNPDLGVAELARLLGRPRQAIARLFPSAVGMSARDYLGWLKLRRMYDVMFTPRSLTDVAHDAGFSDAPQFSRAYQRWYGRAPSTTRDPSQVRVFIHSGNGRDGRWTPKP